MRASYKLRFVFLGRFFYSVFSSRLFFCTSSVRTGFAPSSDLRQPFVSLLGPFPPLFDPPKRFERFIGISVVAMHCFQQKKARFVEFTPLAEGTMCLFRKLW